MPSQVLLFRHAYILLVCYSWDAALILDTVRLHCHCSCNIFLRVTSASPFYVWNPWILNRKWTVSYETHTRAQYLSLFQAFSLEVKNSHNKKNYASEHEAQRTDQTNLTWDCKPRINCDNRNASSACSTKEAIPTTSGGSFETPTAGTVRT